MREFFETLGYVALFAMGLGLVIAFSLVGGIVLLIIAVPVGIAVAVVLFKASKEIEEERHDRTPRVPPRR